MRRFFVSCAIAVLASLALTGYARAEDVVAEAAAEAATAPVRLDGRTLLAVGGISSRTPQDRAEAISQRLKDIAGDPDIAVDALGVVPGPGNEGLEIRAGTRLIMLVTDGDARREGASPALVANAHKVQFAEAITRYRADRSPERLWRSALVSLAATGALVLAIWLTVLLFRRFDALLERRYGTLTQAGHGKVGDVLRVAPMLSAMRGSIVTTRIVAIAILFFVWFEVVLGQFPWTRWLSDDLAGLLLDPLATIFVGIADYIPKLLFLVVLFLVARFGLRMLRLYFGALERGTVSLPGFEPEWSIATYKIVRVLVVGIVLVMAYPYLPGAGSEALQGLSVFAGLVLSLGASSSVSNVIAGYITTFGRVLRVGDMIKVGDTTGTVSQIRLLTIRLRTVRNEEVTIPNGTLLNTNVINYSALSRESGLILQTEVGIGYEVPWRQVHAMLLEAAARTPVLMTEPPPFVLQRQLGDFAVVYQLNVYKAEAKALVRAYSELHQNVLDVFNEYGVQIMTPAYEGDPETPKLVPREQWFQSPARPPDAGGKP
ncbi:MAG: mechanosensitive ion channel family protein [Gammaproteobacteria bacterium]